MIHLHCWTHEGIVFIPTVVWIKGGGSIDIDPVAVVSISDRPELTDALDRALIRPIAIMPPLPRDDARPNPVFKYTRAKSWGAFERKETPWSISKHEGVYTIVAWRKARGEGHLYDENRCQKLPTDASPKEAVRRLIEILEGQAD